MGRKSLRLTVLAGLALAALAAAMPLGAATPVNKYVVTPLISDQPGQAPVIDANLVNPWGLASSATSPWWAADQGTSKSTLYTGAGAINPIVVDVQVRPTGVVFAGVAGQFQVATDTSSTLGNANFIFSGLDGKIHAWRGGAVAQLVADRSAASASYTGLAIAGTGTAARIYAANFRGGTIDVFDGAWAFQTPGPTTFVDKKLPAGYFPYGIQTIGTRIFVTYAMKAANGRADRVDGEGIVDVFDTSGVFLHRVASHGGLNAPWGLAQAPATFGRFANDLLVGNFGNGRINAFAEQPDGSWKHDSYMRGPRNEIVAIDGLWAIQFARGGNNGTAGTLYFTAGPVNETHGLFGKILPAS